MSLPISTVARLPLRTHLRRSSRPVACPSIITKSGVIGATPTSPRTPSVPKYFLCSFMRRLWFAACSATPNGASLLASPGQRWQRVFKRVEMFAITNVDLESPGNALQFTSPESAPR